MEGVQAHRAGHAINILTTYYLFPSLLLVDKPYTSVL